MTGREEPREAELHLQPVARQYSAAQSKTNFGPWNCRVQKQMWALESCLKTVHPKTLFAL